MCRTASCWHPSNIRHQSLASSLRCVLSFSEGVSSSEVRRCRDVGFRWVFSCISRWPQVSYHHNLATKSFWELSAVARNDPGESCEWTKTMVWMMLHNPTVLRGTAGGLFTTMKQFHIIQSFDPLSIWKKKKKYRRFNSNFTVINSFNLSLCIVKARNALCLWGNI